MAALNRVKVPTDQSTGPIGQTGLLSEVGVDGGHVPWGNV